MSCRCARSAGLATHCDPLDRWCSFPHRRCAFRNESEFTRMTALVVLGGIDKCSSAALTDEALTANDSHSAERITRLCEDVDDWLVIQRGIGECSDQSNDIYSRVFHYCHNLSCFVYTIACCRFGILKKKLADFRVLSRALIRKAPQQEFVCGVAWCDVWLVACVHV